MQRRDLYKYIYIYNNTREKRRAVAAQEGEESRGGGEEEAAEPGAQPALIKKCRERGRGSKERSTAGTGKYLSYK